MHGQLRTCSCRFFPGFTPRVDRSDMNDSIMRFAKVMNISKRHSLIQTDLQINECAPIPSLVQPSSRFLQSTPTAPANQRSSAGQIQLLSYWFLSRSYVQQHNGFGLSCFGEAVRKRRAAVAHKPLPFDSLRTVQMPQCCVLCSDIKCRRINGICSSYLDRTLRIAFNSAQDINMAHGQIHRIRPECLSKLSHQPAHFGTVCEAKLTFVAIACKQFCQTRFRRVRQSGDNCPLISTLNMKLDSL
ncbi:hypothetical protein D3C73_935840 [compost metagenome]